MNVKICIGSACHLKGSKVVIDKLQTLIAQNGLTQKVELNGAFCSNNCVNGVCVTINDTVFSVSPETVDDFFTNEIVGRL